MPLLTATTVLRHVEVLRPSPLPPIAKKCGGKVAQDGGDGGYENPLGVSSPTHIYIFVYPLLD